MRFVKISGFRYGGWKILFEKFGGRRNGKSDGYAVTDGYGVAHPQRDGVGGQKGTDIS